MKATDLMINDLILFNGKQFKVHSEFIMFYDKGEYNKKNIDISPIPLTEDILKANEIDISKDYQRECLFNRGVTYSFDSNRVYIGGDIVPAFITSVHKLQHALRLCKRNELADNFKLGTRK